MPSDQPLWEQFDGSALFLERGFIEETWSLETALARFKERYGQAGTRESLRRWWKWRTASMGHAEFLGRAVESAVRTAAAIEQKIRASGVPGAPTLAALLGNLALNLGTSVRLDMASGSFKPKDPDTQRVLRLVAVLADKSLKAEEAAGRWQERALRLRSLELALAARPPGRTSAGSAGEEPSDRILSQETLEKIERELGLL